MDLYEIMKSRLRFVPKRHDIPTVKEQMICTTNPWGKSKDKVYDYFIRGAKYCEIQETEELVIDEIVVNKKMAIFGSWQENIYLKKSYVAKMMAWKVTDPTKWKALGEGRWDTSLGGMFEKVYNEDKVKIEDFILPRKGGFVYRSMDWGTTDPYSVSYWYECNGGEVITTIDGNDFAPPKGSLILFNEMYGGTLQRPQDGNDMTAGEVSELILEKEEYIRNNQFDNSRVIINPGPSDTQIWSNYGTELTIYDEFKNSGVKWKKSVKGAGSRVAGINKFKEMLIATNKRNPNKPWILVFESCEHFFNNVPNLQRDEKRPDDVCGVDHKMDDIRYAITWKRPKSYAAGIL